MHCKLTSLPIPSAGFPLLNILWYPAYLAVAAAGCGFDLQCICPNDIFWPTIQGVFATGACSPSEAKSTFVAIVVCFVTA